MRFPALNIRWTLVLLAVFIMSNNSLYSQFKTPKVKTHTESVKTENGTAKVNILDKFSKKIKPFEYRMYNWYLDGKVHFSNGGYSGKLLHGAYTSTYSSGNIDEQGKYEYGLKQGIWKKWFASGILNTVTTYKNGIKCGAYREYDEKGNLTIKARFKNGLLAGSYKNYKDGVFLIKTKYRKGVEVIPKQKKGKVKVKTEKNNTTDERKPCFIKRI